MDGRKSTVKLTNAERVALWRQRQRESPRKHAEYKRKERERYQEKKKRGVIKPINEMNAREQRTKRRGWRKSSKQYYKRKKEVLQSIENTVTPPASPEASGLPQQQVARQLGRRKVRKDRSKAYREIFRLRIALKREERLKEKYKKRWQRHSKGNNRSKKEDNIIKSHDGRKAILLFSILTQRIIERYNNTKSQEEKRKLSALVTASRLLRKYRLTVYAKNMFGFTNHQMQNKKQNRKPTLKTLRVKQTVSLFYERDDNSRIKADKKATITKGGIKKQIRLLNDDMKHLHKKFNAEMGQRKISYSLFCKLRPFWVRAPTSKDRETCLCKIHDNLAYKLETASAEKLYNSKNLNDIIKTITCDNSLDNKDCMYRTCENCKEKKIPKNDVDMGKQTHWRLWKNKQIETTKKTKVTQVVREVEKGTLETLDSEVNNEVERAARHIFNISHQYKAMTFLKDNINENEILLHMDFSENFTCKLESEIQSMHFGASQRQISIHTGIAYTKEKQIPFATVSDCLVHNPSGIWGHLKPIFENLKPVENGKTVIHFLTDGPTTQYRNKINMYLFSTKIFDLGFICGTWNYLEAGHGKGAADGIGAVVKRTGDRHVLAGHDIKCAADLKDALKDSSIQIFEVNETDITGIDAPLAASIKAVPKTMRIHQVTVHKPGVVHTRDLSCFCNRLTFECSCFEPVMTVFNMEKPSLTNPDTVLPDNVPAETSAADKLPPISALPDAVLPDTVPAETSAADKLPGDDVLEQVVVLDESLVGKYCVVEYEGLPYPGIIQDVDDEGVEVAAMNRIGPNRFFWPMIEDRFFYEKHEIVTLLKDEPKHVTKRHQQLPEDIWKAIVAKLELDDQGKKSY